MAVDPIEVVKTFHLTLDGCVASLRKMLTYYRVCSAFSSAYAVPSGVIWNF
jgi:hypothetical protein